VFSEPADWAYPIAAKNHPEWLALSAPSQNLMARNTHQVLGHTLCLQCPRVPTIATVPVSCDLCCGIGFTKVSSFVLCWTPDGADGKRTTTTRRTGGTGQAIRLAARYNVPLYNLARPDHMKLWSDWIDAA